MDLVLTVFVYQPTQLNNMLALDSMPPVGDELWPMEEHQQDWDKWN